MEEQSLQEMVDKASNTLSGSLFSPKPSPSRTFDWKSLLFGFFQGFLDKCKPANENKQRQILQKWVKKAEKGKSMINAPMWAYDAAAEAGFASGTAQESAIHSALLYVGSHPDEANTMIMKYKNERERLGHAPESSKANGVATNGPNDNGEDLVDE